MKSLKKFFATAALGALATGMIVIVVTRGVLLVYPTVTREISIYDDDNPLRKAIDRKDDLATISKLLETDPGLLTKPHLDGMSAIHHAVTHERADLVRLFASKGLDINARSVGETWDPRAPGRTTRVLGRPPIDFAIVVGNLDVVKAVVECGADLDYVDKYGRDVLKLAARSEKPEAILQYLEKVIEQRDRAASKSQ